jgi:hypothetical protein
MCVVKLLKGQGECLGLKVTYRSEAGLNDAIAWYVPDLSAIKQLLESR